ncbi:MAG: AAA family ATPase, partial [Lachnospiraceae bacterium]|nr:AAA family ATPase [Lachnospiraceae bacterium]
MNKYDEIELRDILAHCNPYRNWCYKNVNFRGRLTIEPPRSLNYMLRALDPKNHILKEPKDAVAYGILVWKSPKLCTHPLFTENNRSHIPVIGRNNTISDSTALSLRMCILQDNAGYIPVMIVEKNISHVTFDGKVMQSMVYVKGAAFKSFASNGTPIILAKEFLCEDIPTRQAQTNEANKEPLFQTLLDEEKEVLGKLFMSAECQYLEQVMDGMMHRYRLPVEAWLRDSLDYLECKPACDGLRSAMEILFNLEGISSPYEGTPILTIGDVLSPVCIVKSGFKLMRELHVWDCPCSFTWYPEDENEIVYSSIPFKDLNMLNTYNDTAWNGCSPEKMAQWMDSWWSEHVIRRSEFMDDYFENCIEITVQLLKKGGVITPDYRPTEQTTAVIFKSFLSNTLNWWWKRKEEEEEEEKERERKERERKEKENILIKRRTIGESASFFKRMEQELCRTVVGQDAAVASVVKGLYKATVNPTSDMPLATFLLVGPPGVGKTFLAKQVAKKLEMPSKIFSMNEYAHDSDYHGLVGFEKAWKNSSEGLLTKFVSENPRSVIVFDEIEKAHANTVRLFLSVLEGGYLDDLYTEEKVDFSRTICVFTTNAGRDYFEAHYGENFSALSEATLMDIVKNDLARSGDAASDMSKDGLSAFPSEVLSRLSKGNIIAFSHMNIEKMLPMIRVGMEEGKRAIEDKLGIQVSYDAELFSYLLPYTLGTKMDARNAVAKSRNFLVDSTYQMLGRISESGDAATAVKEINFEIAEKEDMAKEYTNRDYSGHIIVSCKRDLYDTLPKDYKYAIPNYVYSRWEDGEEAIARACFDSRAVEAVFIDFNFGKNINKESEVEGLTYIDGHGKRVFDWIRKNHPGVPIYGISFDDEYSLSDQELLRKEGIKDFFVIAEGTDFSKIVDTILYNRFLESKLLELQRSGEVLTFDLGTKMSKDKMCMSVVLHHFARNRSMEKDADELFVTPDAVSNIRFHDVIGAE